MKRVRLGSLVAAVMPAIVLLSVSHSGARSLWSFDKDQSTFESAQVNETTLSPPWPTFAATIGNDSVATVMDCFGTFGIPYSYRPPDPNPGLSYQIFPDDHDQVEYLFAGALWVGGIVGGDTLVSVGNAGWLLVKDFTPTNSLDGKFYGTTAPFRSIFDYSLRSEFSDTLTDYANPWATERTDPLDRPLDIVVAERAHVMDTGLFQYGILYDLVITNVGDQTIEDGYIGLLMDADICGYCGNTNGFADDITGGLKNQKIAYAHDNDGDPGSWWPTPNAIATRVLYVSSADSLITNYNWWMSNGNAALDFGPRLKGTPEDPFRDFVSGGYGTPTTRYEQYYMLYHREWDYDQVMTAIIPNDDSLWLSPGGDAVAFVGGWDTRYLLSTGPFTIMPDSSCRVIFTNYAGGVQHTVLGNENNLPSDPHAYLDGLNLDTLGQRGLDWDNLVDDLLDPMNAVVGLKTIVNNDDSTVIEWDPTVVAEVEGYDVYVTPLNIANFPYPGVIPPWYQTLAPLFYQSLPRDRAITLTGLEHNQVYLVDVANRTASGTGAVGDGIHIKPGGRAPAPIPLLDYTFGLQADSMMVEIGWNPAKGQIADHYNIYRFDNAAAAASKYHAMYDLGEFRTEAEPFDSAFANDQYYFYYQMEPIATVDGATLTFTDLNAHEGAVYSIAAVDSIGFESEFSTNIEVDYVNPPYKDILVVSNGANHFFSMVETDSIKAFYDRVLDGYNWDFFDVADSTKLENCPEQDFSCFDWHNFTRYRLTIFDDNLWDGAWSKAWEYDQRGLYKYPHTGFPVAYFGSVRALNEFSTSAPAGIYTLSDTILNGPLAADSFYYVGLTDYILTGGLPTVDSLFGLIGATPVEEGWPELFFDPIGNDIKSDLGSYWPNDVAPAVGAFYPNDQATILYGYNSAYPSSSLLHGNPVGYTIKRGLGANYFFGFHLWYMNETNARALVDKIMENAPLDVVEQVDGTLPKKFELYQNYPNPFNPSTTIRYDLPTRSHVRLQIFNLLGQDVTTLVNTTQSAGSYKAEWNGRDQNGQPVASGVYFYRLTIDNKSYSRKMVLLK